MIAERIMKLRGIYFFQIKSCAEEVVLGFELPKVTDTDLLGRSSGFRDCVWNRVPFEYLWLGLFLFSRFSFQITVCFIYVKYTEINCLILLYLCYSKLVATSLACGNCYHAH